MDYDPEGLCEELHNNKQWLVLAAVTSTLFALGAIRNDRILRSRISSTKMAGHDKSETSKDERGWTERVAGSTDMSSGLSPLARIQKKRREAKEASSVQNKIS